MKGHIMSQNKNVPASAITEAPAIVSADTQEQIGSLALFGSATGMVASITMEQIRAALDQPAWTPAPPRLQKYTA